MKNILFAIFATLIFLSSGRIYSQSSDYPLHLFLGEFTRITDSDTTVEMWNQVDDNELTGKSIYTYSGGSFLSETLRIVYVNGKLNYCATVLEQNPYNPQGEVCFELKSFKDMVFTFENKQHDFPKRIIYDFSGWRKINARVEDDSKGFDIEFTRDYNMFRSYTAKGVILKVPFENKIGKIVEGVYDYFFQVQGVKYFIKLSDSQIKKDAIDKYLNKEIKVAFFIKDGLWDSDDNSHQSRIGNYISIVNIY